jgi:peptide/nickel transport system permease protein
MLRRTFAAPPARFGGVLVIAFVAMALLAPVLVPMDPTEAHLLDRLEPPTFAGGEGPYLLGTDHLGRDILSRVVYGSRVALAVGFLGVSLAVTVGVTLGVLAGYFGGTLDDLVMRLVDVLQSVPNVLLYLTVLGVFGPSFTVLVMVIGFVNWTTFARVVRAEVLSVRQREFVEAARAGGQRAHRIIVRHVLPNALAPIVVVATINLATVIILEASLSFLGLGVQPPVVTWGRMLADGRSYLATAWWISTFPGIVISLACLGLILVGDGLRDALDPRGRH